MKNYLFLFLAGLVMCSCVKKTERIETVAVDFNVESSDSFIDKISGITLIPLETNDSLFIGADNELIMADGEYYLVNLEANNKVFRFSAQGKFLNSIGTKGRGPGEYLGLKNAQIVGDTVIIYSRPQMILNFYTKDGIFISQQINKENEGTYFYKIEGDYLAYIGYGMEAPGRLCLFSPKDNSKKFFLETDAEVLNIDDVPAFYVNGNDLYIRENYNDTVSRYDIARKTVTPYLKFDLGKHALDEKFFQFADAFKAMEYFMSLEYAAVHRYMENDKMRFVEITVAKKPMPDMLYGLCLNGESKWVWFSGGKIDTGSLANSFRLLSGDKLYCLMEPFRLKNLTPAEKAKITNPQVLDTLAENSNPVIGIVEF
ncbi:MAG: 6-bladed beta-propeller [Bacteroidales bacterium]